MCGGDVETCKRILRECLLEFDTAIAAGHTVHRVAVRLFAKDGACRMELELWLVSDNPLSFFSTAYRILLEYSLCSPVERIIEAVHAMIKRIGSQAPNSLPPSIVTKLREYYNLELLRTNLQFEQFVYQMWNSTRLLDSTLALRFDKPALAAMGRLKKISAIYQCTLESEHEDVTAAVKRVKDMAILDGQLHAPPLPKEADLCVKYFKDLFQPGHFYTMAAALADRVARSEFQIDGGRRLVEETIQCSVSPPSCFDETSVAGVIVFVVLNSRPENRYTVKLPHIEEVRTLMHVSVCKVLKWRTGEIIVHQDDSEHSAFDLRVLASTMSDSMQSIFEWDASSVQSALKMRPFVVAPVCTPELGDTYPLLGVADIVGTVPRGRVDGHDIVAAGPSVSSTDGMIDLNLLRRQAVTAGGGGVAFAEQHLHMDRIDELAATGAINVSTDDFGEAQLDIVRERVTWSTLVLLKRPRPLSHLLGEASKLLNLSKLEVMVRLAIAGWGPGEELTLHEPSSLLTYVPDITRPLSYFCALLRPRPIFDKGVTSIRHVSADAYYRCLLNVPGPQLLRILDSPEASVANNKWYADQAAEVGVEVENELIEETPPEPLPLALPDLVEGGDVQSLHPPVVQDNLWSRCLASSFGHAPVKVYFDKASDGSSRQRGWSTCNTHECRRYRYCDLYASKELFAADQVLWLEAENEEECRTHDAHMGYRPSETDVQQLAATIALRHF